jgi:hypothetical protein
MNVRHDNYLRLAVGGGSLSITWRLNIMRGRRHSAIADQLGVAERAYTVKIARRRNVTLCVNLGPVPPDEIQFVEI